MSDLDLEPPPRGCRWETDADRKGGRVRARRSVHVSYGIGIAWAALVLLLSRKGEGGLAFLLFGFALASAYLVVRSVVNTTSVRFRDGRLVCVTGPLPPRRKLEHDASDILGFVAQPAPGNVTNTFGVALVTRGDHRIPLPLDLDGLLITGKGSRRAIFGAAPIEDAAFVARRLDEALEIARREGGHYRVAPGTAPGEELRSATSPTLLREEEEPASYKAGTSK